MRIRRDREFEEWVRGHLGTMQRTATALTGGDVHLAEDLVQVTLVRLYAAWPRARTMNVLAYARRILLNLLIDDKRRSVNRHERVRSELPDVAVNDDLEPAVGAALLAALRELPAGMRAAVVLRHVEGLTVEETAAALDASEATVRSQVSRGLDRLRGVLELSAVSVHRSPPPQKENLS